MKPIILMALLALAGCASSPPTNSVVVRCGINRAWTPAEELELANALEPLPTDSPILKLEMDWQAMRDANAACKTKGNLQ